MLRHVERGLLGVLESIWIVVLVSAEKNFLRSRKNSSIVVEIRYRHLRSFSRQPRSHRSEDQPAKNVIPQFDQGSCRNIFFVYLRRVLAFSTKGRSVACVEKYTPMISRSTTTGTVRALLSGTKSAASAPSICRLSYDDLFVGRRRRELKIGGLHYDQPPGPPANRSSSSLVCKSSFSSHEDEDPSSTALFQRPRRFSSSTGGGPPPSNDDPPRAPNEESGSSTTSETTLSFDDPDALLEALIEDLPQEEPKWVKNFHVVKYLKANPR